MPKCKYCGETIGFIKTGKGKMMPVEPGLTQIMTNQGRLETGQEPHHPNCEKREKAMINRESQGVIENGTCSGDPYSVERFLSYTSKSSRFPTLESFDLTLAGETHNFISENELHHFLEGYKAAKQRPL